MKRMPSCRTAAVALALALPMAAEAMWTSPRIRLETDLHGLDVAIRTSTAAVALVHMENRLDRTVFCSVGFFHGFDLRQRRAHALGPGEKQFDYYPVRQRVGSVPVEVICTERRQALPHNYL